MLPSRRGGLVLVTVRRRSAGAVAAIEGEGRWARPRLAEVQRNVTPATTWGDGRRVTVSGNVPDGRRLRQPRPGPERGRGDHGRRACRCRAVDRARGGRRPIRRAEEP